MPSLIAWEEIIKHNQLLVPPLLRGKFTEERQRKLETHNLKRKSSRYRRPRQPLHLLFPQILNRIRLDPKNRNQIGPLRIECITSIFRGKEPFHTRSDSCVDDSNLGTQPLGSESAYYCVLTCECLDQTRECVVGFENCDVRRVGCEGVGAG
jgi:hypothetical protein